MSAISTVIELERKVVDAERENLRACLRLMISYLGHEDQDANHEWMAKKMRAVLNGERVGVFHEAEWNEINKENE